MDPDSGLGPALGGPERLRLPTQHSLRALMRLTTRGGKPEIAQPYIRRFEERMGKVFGLN